MLALAAVASARVMDHLAAVPQGWEKTRTASPDEPIFLRVALKQHPGRVKVLDQAALDIATPGHPNYGMHMTRDELRSYTAPSDDAVAAVSGWLRDHAIQPLVDHDWVSFTTTVGTASELLGTQFAWYRYRRAAGSPVLRALSYSVPDHVAAHIDLVQPTTRFGSLGARKSSIFDMYPLVPDEDPAPGTKVNFAADSLDVKNCTSTVIPECLRKLYNIHYKPAAPEAHKVAFASYLEEYARYDDLAAFEKRLVPDAVGVNVSVELVNGGMNIQDSDGDSSKPLLFFRARFGTILTPTR
jgi:tripeptidyl-peptidase-1